MKKRLPVLLMFILTLSLLSSVVFAAPFPDVPEGEWYYETVTEMAGQGIVKGYPDGRFGPLDPISRAEFVTITARLAGQKTVNSPDYWARQTMEDARNAGWYDWDEIPPAVENFAAPISRQLAVKIMMGALLPDARGDYTTESAKIRDFSALNGRYYEAVLGAYSVGLILGDGEGNFRPLDGLTRAEACAIFQRAGKLAGKESLPTAEPLESREPVTPVAVSGGVSQNGKLHVAQGQLVSETGEPILLRGMSSHGLHWFPQYTSANAIRNTAAYGANVFRVAMYTGEGGYLSQPETVKRQLLAAVDAAISQDMYVILDWHILSDGDPSAHTDEAVAFFTEMAQKYGQSPAVLFEICNEPNGGITWSGHVKPYAEKVVAAIRAQGAENVILIGSPTWSQDIDKAADDPVAGENLMYTLHFYAGTHGEWLRQRIDQCRKKGLPIFVSEWGTSRADGSGGVFLEESKVWLDFLESRGISWCNWSLCDKKETSAALVPGTSPDKTWSESDLTESGKFVFSRFGE